jgi:hypothetical protein
MHTITLQVKDSMYEHFLYLLKNLNPKEITVIDEKLSKTSGSLKKELHKLFEETNIKAFKDIEDPVEWQRKQRDEW